MLLDLVILFPHSPVQIEAVSETEAPSAPWDALWRSHTDIILSFELEYKALKLKDIHIKIIFILLAISHKK